MECNITAEVYCSWSEVPPIYRIYVDNDLYTERTFHWSGYQSCVVETIICNLENGIHELRIEHCGGNGKFNLRNVTHAELNVIKHPNYSDPEEHKWTFIVGYEAPPPPPYVPVGLDFRVAQN